MRTQYLFALGLVLSTGCSLVVADEVGDLRQDQNSKRDVRVTLLDMDPHIGQHMDVQIVLPETAAAEAQIQARAILDPTPVPCFELSWQLGAPLAASRVDFYADLNGDGAISDPGDDHLWRRELTDQMDGTGVLSFVHDVSFDDIRINGARGRGPSLEVTLTGIDEHDGRLAVVVLSRQFREEAGQPLQESVVGIGVTSVASGMMNITIPGVLDAGDDHRLEIDFGEGTLTCRGSVTAPTGTGDTLTVDSLDDLDCAVVTDRRIVFRDLSDDAICR